MATKKTLTLKEKVDVITFHEKHPKIGSREIAVNFGVGRTQIQNILKRKNELKSEFEANQPSTRKRRIRTTENDDVNKLTWEWFKDVVSRQLPVTGPMLQERAKLFAEQLKIDTFKGSNGWLESFRKRHNISFSTRCGESADVPDGVVDDWKQKLPKIIEDYELRDTYNMDETGLFFRQTTNKTLFHSGEKCSGGKKVKVRMTVMLCANVLGEKEKALVIWKYKNPRCFKKMPHNQLPVHYYANKNAWMTSGLFEDWVKKLDRKMQHQKRKILLFMDNASSHSHLNLKNIKLQFFPANTTSKLQPMDQGIIQATKLKYRKLQLRKMIVAMEKDKTICASQLLKEVDVLQAIYWIKQAWDDVKAETIQKCFINCGFKEQTLADGKFFA